MSEMTYESIVEIAMRNSDRQTLDAGNEEFFARLRERSGEAAVQLFKDNILLEWMGFNLHEEAGYEIFVSDMQKVYAAAKLMFARHPGKTFTYDLDSVSGGFGSPWEHTCETPEEWVICYARRELEDDEASVTRHNKAKVAQVCELLDDLIQKVGIPEATMLINVDMLCYGNTRLEKKVLQEVR